MPYPRISAVLHIIFISFTFPSRFRFNFTLYFVCVDKLLIDCSFVQFFLFCFHVIIYSFTLISFHICRCISFKPIQTFFIQFFFAILLSYHDFYMHSLFFIFFIFKYESLYFQPILLSFVHLKIFSSIFIIYQTSTNQFLFAYFTYFLVCIGELVGRWVRVQNRKKTDGQLNDQMKRRSNGKFNCTICEYQAPHTKKLSKLGD